MYIQDGVFKEKTNGLHLPTPDPLNIFSSPICYSLIQIMAGIT